jgi:large subunit ribosomal protein L35
VGVGRDPGRPYRRENHGAGVDHPGGEHADPHEEQGQDMPKNKTHSGTKKRIKVTGTGKLLRERAGKRHLLEKKSSHKTRQLSGNDVVAPQDTGRIRRMLGNS